MDKAFLKRTLVVIMGVCAIVLIFQFASLISIAAGLDDVIDHVRSTLSISLFVKWTSVATVLIMIPLFASYVFSCLSKNVIFRISSAALSLLVALCAISFAVVLNDKVLSADWKEADYTVYTTFLEEMITVAVPCFVGFIFYTVSSVQALRRRSAASDKAEVKAI